MLKKFQNCFPTILILLLVAVVLGACNSESADSEGDSNSDSSKTELFKLKQITSWFPQIEQAGQYSAKVEGYYEEAGIDMTIQPGGPGVSGVSIVASGEADIGMVQADQLLFAINEGIPLVAIMTNFQVTPQGIMFHKGEPIKTFDDLGKGGYEIYTGASAGYWQYLLANFDIDPSQNRVYSGDNSTFAANKKAASQMYVTSEPYYLKQEGIETEHLLIADSGYEIYGDVLFTTKKFLEENPDIVQAYVDATVKGWETFRGNPENSYNYIMELDNTKTVEQMSYAKEEMDELVFGGDAEEHGVGYMSEERWQQLIDQLYELKLIDKKIDAKDVFTSEFLSK